MGLIGGEMGCGQASPEMGGHKRSVTSGGPRVE